MSTKTLHWLLASGAALAIHGVLLVAFVRAPPPLVEVAGGRIEVNFGNSGRNTANATADRGGETVAEPEPLTPDEPPPDIADDAIVEESSELAPPAEPEPAPDLPPQNPQPATTEPEPVRNEPAPSPQQPDEPIDTPAQTREHDVQTGSNTTSQSEDGPDAIDSVASPTSGSPAAGAQSDTTNLQMGDSDATNYAGKIVSILSRKRLPSSVPRGSALVSFSMQNDGGIVSIEIARSSGSKRFDRAAMRLIKAAAPFPKPPRGAMLDYTVVIKKD
ncbi:MAG: TonB family protein [Pseudomonadota bacterium]